VSACVTLVAERAGGQLSCVRAGTSHLTRGHGAGSTEHEWSRIVYGMPRAAIERGAVDPSVPLSRMAEATVLAPSAAPLVDRVQAGLPYDVDPRVQVIPLEDLGLDALPTLVQKYNIIELNTAVKPDAFFHLFRLTGATKILYLDPDI